MRTLRIISMTSLAALWLALPASVSAAMPHSGRIAQTSVRVMNDSSEPIVVLLLDAQAQYPLGTVDGHTMQTLAVPPEAVGVPNVRLVATSFSDRHGIESRPMTLDPGEQVDALAELSAFPSEIVVH